MSYDRRVAQAVENPNEQDFIDLIQEPVEAQDSFVKSKEAAINGLAQLYVDTNQPEKIKSIAIKYEIAYSATPTLFPFSPSPGWPRSLKI